MTRFPFLVALVAAGLAACSGGGGPSGSLVPTRPAAGVTAPQADSMPPSYTMTALPIFAKAINNAGVVVGAAVNSRAAAKYDHGSITIYPQHAGSQGAQALDINDNGLAVGYDTSGKQSGATCVISSYLAIFHQDGSVSYVGPQPYPNAELVGINSNGVSTGLFGPNAVSYSPLMTVFQPTGGGTTARGNAINDNGVIVGEYSVEPTDTLRKPFVVPAQPNCCGTATYGTASDINAFNHIVGDSFASDPSVVMGWFYANGTTTTLPLLAGGTFNSPRALNDSDVIVGLADTGGQERGVLWKNGRVYDLNSLVTNKPVGAQIQDASDINNSGQIIVFVPFLGSQTFLLTPQ